LSIAKTGNFEEAIHLVEGINEYDKWQTLSDIISIMAHSGALGSALRLAKKIEVDEYKTKALIEIISLVIEKEINESKINFLESVLETAHGIREKKYKIQALFKIASAMAQSGNGNRARFIFETTLKIIEAIDYSLDKSISLEYAASALARAGDFEGRPALFVLTLKLTEKIGGGEWDSVGAVTEILSEIANAEIFDDFEALIKTTDFSNKTWEMVLPEWRSSIIEYDQDSMGFLRRSFLYFPFSLKSAYNGVFSLITAHISQNSTFGYQSIIRLCPMLDLAFLLEEDNQSCQIV